jgi:hypothetical protein
MIFTKKVLMASAGLGFITIAIGGILETAQAANLNLTSVDSNPTMITVVWTWNGEPIPANELNQPLPSNRTNPWSIKLISLKNLPTTQVEAKLFAQHLEFKINDDEHKNSGDGVFFTPRSGLPEAILFTADANGNIDNTKTPKTKEVAHAPHFDFYTLQFKGKTNKGGTLTLIGKHNKSRVTTPESSPMLGILTLSALGTSSLLKRKFEKREVS